MLTISPTSSAQGIKFSKHTNGTPNQGALTQLHSKTKGHGP